MCTREIFHFQKGIPWLHLIWNFVYLSTVLSSSAANLLEFAFAVLESQKSPRFLRVGSGLCSSFCSSIWLQVEEFCYNRVLNGDVECTLHLNHLSVRTVFLRLPIRNNFNFSDSIVHTFFQMALSTDSPLHLLPDVLESLRHLGYVNVRKTKCRKYSEK